MADIKYLFSKKMIPWVRIYFYYRESIELKKPHIMIVSSIPLKDYEILKDYSVLRNNVI